MREIFTIAKFTILDLIKKKAFIISTIVTLLLIVVGFNIPNIIKAFSSSDNELTKIIIKDVDKSYTTLTSSKQETLGYEFVLEDKSVDEIKEEITKEDTKVDEALIITRKDNNLDFEYIVPNASGMTTALPSNLISYLTEVYKMEQIGKLSLTETEKASINPVITTKITSVGEEAKGNVLIMMFISIALFFAIYYTAFQVSSSITLEKTSKIIETLVTSTKPRNIVVGKTLGIGIVGLCQSILIGGVAVLCAFFCLGKELLASVVDLSFVTWGLAILTVVYFILGYFVYAFLYALTGSTVSKPEDVQSANGPVSLVAIVGFYIAYFTLMNPTSSFNKFAALFPFSSPFCETSRIMMGLATPFELICSIGILIATIVLIAYISIKIYHNAILNYGSKLNFKDLVNMFKQK